MDKRRVFLELFAVGAASLLALAAIYIARPQIMRVTDVFVDVLGDSVGVSAAAFTLLVIFTLIVVAITLRFNGARALRVQIPRGGAIYSIATFALPVMIVVVACQLDLQKVGDLLINDGLAFKFIVSIIIVVACATMEEFIFRSWLAAAIGKIAKTAYIPAIVTSAIFALVHTKGNVAVYVLLFALAILWFWSATYIGSIIIAVSSHSSYNVIVDIIAPNVEALRSATNAAPDAILVILLGVPAVILSTVIFTMMSRSP